MKEPQPALDLVKTKCHKLALQIYSKLECMDESFDELEDIIYKYESEKINLQSELSTAQEQNRQLVAQYDAKCRELLIAEKAWDNAMLWFSKKCNPEKVFYGIGAANMASLLMRQKDNAKRIMEVSDARP